MIIVDLKQGEEAWFTEKLGKPSASNASKILTNEGKPSKQAEGYLYELSAELLSGQREEGYKNAIMAMGVEREDESRKLYELTHNVEVTQVGVIYKDEKKQFLCSPDGIVTKKGLRRKLEVNEYGLELKNVLGKTQVKYLLDGGLPSEYFGQIQFSLYVTGFKFWDFMTYTPGIKPLIIRVEPDIKYIKALEVELELFCSRLDEITERLRKI